MLSRRQLQGFVGARCRLKLLFRFWCSNGSQCHSPTVFSHDSAVLRFLGHNLTKGCVRILLPFLRRALKKKRLELIAKIFVGYRTLIVDLLILIVPVSAISERLV